MFSESARRTAFISLRMALRKTRLAARCAAMEGSTWCSSTKVPMSHRFARTSSVNVVANSHLHALLLRARN